MIYRLLLILYFFNFNLSNGYSQNHWINLFDGKSLKGWDTYLGPPFSAPGDHRTDLKPIGLNIDPKKTFSVVKVDGMHAIRISGEHFGGISTQNEYQNYHLRLQFKWGKLKWPPRLKGKMDSGILYHANGEQGLDNGFWMQGQEFQVQENDCGDYWGCAGAIMDVPSFLQQDSTYRYDPSGELHTFQDKTAIGRHAVRSQNFEKPSGEWNTLDLYCMRDTAMHIVNGHVVMILYHSKHIKNGNFVELTKGKIQIQSEGAEVYYRGIQLTKIKELPKMNF